MTSFGLALHEELQPHGVRVTTLCPGYTHTEFHARAGVDTSGMPGLLWQDADTVAAAALDALARGRALCAPGVNRVTATLSAHAPRAVSRKAARGLNSRLR